MLIVQNRSLSCQLQWILEADFMMILVVYCFYTTTVKHRLWIMIYQRNRINSVSFTLLV